jgi:hypothetical protein
MGLLVISVKFGLVAIVKKPRHFVPLDNTPFMYRGSADRDMKSGKMPARKNI